MASGYFLSFENSSQPCMVSYNAEIYLRNPAATAIRGVITDPREFSR